MSGLLRVLVVDDNDALRSALRELIGAAGDFEVVGEAADGAAGVDAAAALRPDAILMDVKMPGMDGIEATRRITAADPRVAVIAHTAYEDADLVADMIRAGASGYLVKGAEAGALFEGIRSAVHGEARISASSTRALFEEVARTGERERLAEDTLEELAARLHEVTRVDGVTDLWSPSAFREEAEAIVGRSRRAGAPVALILVRLPDLAGLNRSWGWAIGDDALAWLADAIRAVGFAGAVCGRAGGAEVAACLPACGSVAAGDAAQSVRDLLARVPFRPEGSPLVQLGVAVLPDVAGDVEDLVAAARAAARSVPPAEVPAVGHAARIRPIDPAAAVVVDRLLDVVAGDDVAVANRARQAGSLAAALCDRLERPSQIPVGRLAAVFRSIADARSPSGGGVDAAARLAVSLAGEDVGAAVRATERAWDSEGPTAALAGRAAAVACAYVVARSLPGADAATALAAVTRSAGTAYDPEVVALLSATVADVGTH